VDKITRILFFLIIGGCFVKDLPAVEIESLGQPCLARNVFGGRTVVDPATGKELFVVINMNEDSGGELIFIDYDQDTARVFRSPAGEGSWSVIEVPGQRLVMGTYVDGMFVVFDLKKMEFVKAVKFPGERYIWNVVLGGDGRIYGGTSEGGKLGALDLTTFAVEDCGAGAPPNVILRKVSALPDDRLLCWFICEAECLKIYDPKTKTFSAAPEAMKGLREGVCWNGYFLIGDKVFDGKTLTLVESFPFPVPAAEKGSWSVDPVLTSDSRLFLQQGQAIYRYEKGDKELTLIADFDLHGAKLLAADRNGAILGVRGQDYFVLRAGDKTLNLKSIPGESSPRPTFFLRVDDRNRLWGGSPLGQTLFWMDLQTKKVVNTGAICDNNGEVYDVAFRGDKVYAVAYVGGDIVEYQPDKPWDQWNGKNPRSLAKMNKYGYIRPEAGVTFGPGGKLYSGWWAKYGTYGGAVAITDPDTGETELIENPFGKQAIHSLAVGDQTLYVGTSVFGNGLANQKDPIAFGVIDLVTKKVVFEKRFEKLLVVRDLHYDAKTRQVVMALYHTFACFDTVKREFVTLSKMPTVTGAVITRDGKAYYSSVKSIIEVDLATHKFRTFLEAPVGVGLLAIGPDGTIYFSSGTDVYRVRRQEK
jgi:hypothetical protein